MMASSATMQNCTFVAIDVTKLVHEALVEPPTGRWLRASQERSARHRRRLGSP